MHTLSPLRLPVLVELFSLNTALAANSYRDLSDLRKPAHHEPKLHSLKAPPSHQPHACRANVCIVSQEAGIFYAPLLVSPANSSARQWSHLVKVNSGPQTSPNPTFRPSPSPSLHAILEQRAPSRRTAQLLIVKPCIAFPEVGPPFNSW